MLCAFDVFNCDNLERRLARCSWCRWSRLCLREALQKSSRCFCICAPRLHGSEDATPRINATSAYSFRVRSSSAAKRFNLRVEFNMWLAGAMCAACAEEEDRARSIATSARACVRLAPSHWLWLVASAIGRAGVIAA